MIIPPISFVVSFALLGPPFPVDRMVSHERFGHGFGFGFATVRAIPFLISVIWLGIGVRQWFVLSSWTKSIDCTEKCKARLIKSWISIKIRNNTTHIHLQSI